MPRAEEGDLVCTMSRNLKVVADAAIGSCAGDAWDLIALPGGMPGAKHLKESAALQALLASQRDSDRLFAAVCAAPAVALAGNGLLEGRRATCYPAPALREALPQASDDLVVKDGNVITSQGPGTSLLFALRCVEALYGKGKADELAAEMLVPVAQPEAATREA
uniref:DJ-1/PfpI domain-containing protein n=2 Tax=Phaeomonas parva TaxID=124430 RepID=A0A7S1U9M4_9STRA|mmetsp:Transcript_37976/g.119166  ORF Transcript_37976/g.119166 Transcript_37976/m.119166 type:complete len:164 (+) Transcript_37976:413-904(+)